MSNGNREYSPEQKEKNAQNKKINEQLHQKGKKTGRKVRNKKS